MTGSLCCRLACLWLLGMALGVITMPCSQTGAQEQLHVPCPLPMTAEPPPVPFHAPMPADFIKPLPINLPTALKLAGVQAVDIAAAAERIQVAAAVLEQARVLWLPT